MRKRKSTASNAIKASQQTLSVAFSVARDIQVANRLSLLSLTARGRLIAFQVMHLKISNAIVRFGQYLQVLSVHDHPRDGILLVLRFCGTDFVATFRALSDEAQDLLTPALQKLQRSNLVLPRAA